MPLDLDRLRSALRDRYAIERELGQGGMSKVYLADDPRHHRKVAVKVLLPEIAATVGTKRFLREIETASRLSHPHILPLYDSGEADGFLYYVMPYVEGDTLRDRITRERQLQIADALRIAREVGGALHYAHGQGVVHRDIKPENILLVDDHAVIADFGIARALDEQTEEKLTGTGLVLGSPEYMSPEQASGEGLDPRADVYALGCVLYEMLTGEPPFTGRTPQAILARRVSEAPPSARAFRETVPIQIDASLMQALARIPADRYATAQEFVEALTPDARTTQELEATGLFAELKRRRVFRVTAFYAVVAWGVVEVASATFPFLGLPDWSVTAIIVLAIAGFPVAAVLAWAYDLTAAGVKRAGRRGKSEAPPLAAPLRLGGAAVILLGIGGLLVYSFQLVRPEPVTLNPSRVMVFPLVPPAGVPPTMGEDVATLISHALDGAAGLRTIDGWTLLDADERENIRLVALARMRELAASKGAAYAVMGRLVPKGADSVDVALELIDVAGDTIALRSSFSGPLDRAWRSGLTAVNGLLPAVIEGSPPRVDAAFDERTPAGIAAFLRGEAAFRRARLTEALEHYQAAVEADSAFGLAAIRGAEAAAWDHEDAQAARLLEAALAQPLPERYLALARGMEAYLDGDAETAIRELQQAIYLDPELAVAWSQLGETYTHLAVRRVAPDSLAEAAFLTAQALDSTAVYVSFHLLEARFRRGEVDEAEPLMRRFLAAEPEPELARQIRLQARCVRDGPRAVDWRREVGQDTIAVLAASLVLAAGGGRQLPCAEAGFRAVLAAVPPDPTDSKVWSATKGVFAVLMARGKGEAAVAFLDSMVALPYEPADRFYTVAALLGAGSVERADSVSEARRRRFSPGLTAGQAWYAGTWAAARGDTAQVVEMTRAADEAASQREVLADSLTRTRSQGADVARNRARHERLLARALVGHLWLARGDTTRALRLFRGLMPNAPRGDVNWAVNWHSLAPLAHEQQRLAELLLARGDPRAAFEVASAFDAPGVLGFVHYLPVSLALRVQAAEAMGEPGIAESLRARYAALTGGAGPPSLGEGSTH